MRRAEQALRRTGVGRRARGWRRALGLASELIRSDDDHRHAPAPPPDGMVVEIGAGQSPYPRTDVVVDKFVEDDFERPGEQGVARNKPLVVADAEDLPFEDLTFSYAIASHVLEHANDPRRFTAELGRVAGRGWVQVPTALAEAVFGWPYHRWVAERSGSGLLMRTRPERSPDIGDQLHEAYATSPLFRAWFASSRDLWHISVEWSGELPVGVTGEPASVRTAEVDLERTRAALEPLAFPPLPPGVAARLRCLSCASPFDRSSAATLSCTGCGAVYPVVGNVPILLREAAR